MFLWNLAYIFRNKLILIQRFLKPWLLFEGIFRLTKMGSGELNQMRRLNEYTKNMITIRRQIMSHNNDVKPQCLLDYMIDISDKNPEFTETDIINQACTFMAAGQDSVAAAVAFTVFLLAQHPDYQQKCCAELERIFGTDNRIPTIQDLRKMFYVEMFIKESLRLYPTAPLFARQLGEDVRLSSYTLPAGSNVFMSPYITHHLAHIYPEPEKFDPERFSPENSEKRHPYAFLAFSAGPRNCIGSRFAMIEMKCVISRLLRSYSIQAVPGKTTFVGTFRIAARASGGLWVRLRARQVEVAEFSC